MSELGDYLREHGMDHDPATIRKAAELCRWVAEHHTMEPLCDLGPQGYIRFGAGQCAVLLNRIADGTKTWPKNMENA